VDTSEHIDKVIECGNFINLPRRVKLPPQQWISCRDAVGRPQSVIMEADRCRVVMVGPPGEAAVLSDDNVTALCTALCAAKEERR
jgi:hypothetical protein